MRTRLTVPPRAHFIAIVMPLAIGYSALAAVGSAAG